MKLRSLFLFTVFMCLHTHTQTDEQKYSTYTDDSNE